MFIPVTKLTTSQVPTVLPSDIKVLTWNIERGQKLENIIAKLKYENADVLLLQELDVQCGYRSKNLDVPQIIAETLEMNCYIFAKEFDEIGINSGTNGIHGNAIISKFPIKEAHAWSKVFETQPFNWSRFGTLLKQPRKGGRNFVACRLGNLLFYSVHTENFLGPEGRIAQMEEVILDAEQKIKEYNNAIDAVIIGGDLNTLRAGITRFIPLYFPKDFRKLLNHEPTDFATWIKERFNAIDATFGQYTTKRISGFYKEKLDWLLMTQTNGKTIHRSNDTVHGGEEDSDHKYICSTFSFKI